MFQQERKMEGNGVETGGMGGNGGEWGEMGENGKLLQLMEENGGNGGDEGKWGEMGGNGGKWEIVTSTSWKMCENVSTRKENGGKWGRNRGKMGEKWDTVRQLLHFSRSHFPHFPYRSPISLQGR